MWLPTLVVASFRRSCQSDIDKIKNFLTEYYSADLAVEMELPQRLERLRATLWEQWRCMETAWYNHDPEDGNVDVVTLARLGEVVEATGMAVHKMLQISGRILGIGRGVTYPKSASLVPDARYGDQRMEILQRTGNVMTELERKAVGGVEANNNNGGRSTDTGKTRGEAVEGAARQGDQDAKKVT